MKRGKYHQVVREFKRLYLAHMLAAHGGNRTYTARTLGLQRSYLLRLLRQHGLSQSGGKSKTLDYA